MLIDPLSWLLCRIQFDGNIFVDSSQPFVTQWTMAACQQVTDCVRLIMAQQGFVMLIYMDNFCGMLASEEQIHAGFHFLKATLASLGLPEAIHKSFYLSRCLSWLGLEFDCTSGHIPDDKLQCILSIVNMMATPTASHPLDTQTLMQTSNGTFIMNHT